MPEGIRAIYRDLSRMTFATLAEAQRYADWRMAEYNRTPQPELGGLSPLQARALLEDPWDNTGPLRIADDVPLAAFEEHQALLIVNARRLMEVLVAEGPLRLTPAGYLPRTFVMRMLDALQLFPGYRENVLEGAVRLSELDVAPIHLCRTVLELARLLRTAGLHLRITRIGRDLVRPERAGALAARLFRTYFREMDLRYVTRGIGAEDVQYVLPLGLWRLSLLGPRWYGGQELIDTITTPEQRRHWSRFGLEWLWGLLVGRVFSPLCDFGLLEIDLDAFSDASTRYRPTPLLGRMLSWVHMPR
jgi:hypothetical protein